MNEIVLAPVAWYQMPLTVSLMTAFVSEEPAAAGLKVTPYQAPAPAPTPVKVMGATLVPLAISAPLTFSSLRELSL